MPAVSVVVPNYNHARFLRQRIDSILAQTYQDFELILLDDCSTDESRDILKEYAADPRVRLELNDTNSGSTFRQWNKGVRLARGKYVWVAESDDYADNRLLERLVPELEMNGEVVLAYCRSWRTFEDGGLDGFADGYLDRWDCRLWKADFCMPGLELCRRFFCGTNMIPNASAVVFRKDVYERIGGPDEGLRLCADWKLWAALALEGKVSYTAEPLNYFRFHQESVRRRKRQLATDVAEDLAVARWVQKQVPVGRETMRRVLRAKANLWVPAMASSVVTRETKREIMREVRAIDPHPAWTAVQFYARRFWSRLANAIYYPILNLTYERRHAMGFTRAGFGRLRMRIVNR